MNEPRKSSVSKTQVACDIYDYIEIACLYRYLLEISLLDGSLFSAIATNTTLNSDRVECMVVMQNQVERFVALNQIHKISALTQGAKFSTVIINEQ